VFVAGDSPLPLDAAIVIFHSDSYCNANNAAQLAANVTLTLPDGMDQNGFIAVDFDAEEGGSSSCQDSIVNDCTQKEILRPNAPVATED
jgi:hypothetical protein